MISLSAIGRPRPFAAKQAGRGLLHWWLGRPPGGGAAIRWSPPVARAAASAARAVDNRAVRRAGGPARAGGPGSRRSSARAPRPGRGPHRGACGAAGEPATATTPYSAGRPLRAALTRSQGAVSQVRLQYLCIIRIQRVMAEGGLLRPLRQGDGEGVPGARTGPGPVGQPQRQRHPRAGIAGRADALGTRALWAHVREPGDRPAQGSEGGRSIPGRRIDPGRLSPCRSPFCLTAARRLPDRGRAGLLRWASILSARPGGWASRRSCIQAQTGWRLPSGTGRGATQPAACTGRGRCPDYRARASAAWDRSG
jgi:hypothetical protein